MNTEEKYDVVIAGGGFAGLYLCKTLSEKYKVCLIEKNNTLNGPLNTTGSTMINGEDDIFTLFGISRDSILNSYNSIKLISENQETCTPKGGFPWALLDIHKLKKEMIEKINPSATILTNHIATDIIRGSGRYDGVVVQDLDSKEYKNITGKIIVDASGSSASLAKKIGISTPARLAKCFQVDATISNKIDHTKIEMYVGFDFCRAGYAYIFPITENRIRIGTCFTSDSTESLTSEDMFKAFVAHKKLELKNIDNELDLSVFTGGIVKRNSRLNFISLGDSAGTLSPIIGEGIRFAFHSGDIAAKIIDKSLVENNHTNLADFYKLWKGRFGLRFSIAYLLQLRISSLSNSKIDALITKIHRILQNDPKFIFKMFATKFKIHDIIKLII